MITRQRVSARRYLEQRCYLNSPIAKASDYLVHLDDLLGDEPLKVILLGRISGRIQNYRGNLDNQIAFMKIGLSGRNVVIARVFRMIQSGWDDDRLVLEVAAELAHKEGAVIVAESPDRFIRSIDFHTKTNPGALPTVAEYEKLMEVVGDVTLATVLPPDAPWKKVRGYQSRRGQIAKGSKPGRPKKTRYKRRDESEISRAREMKGEHSIGKIAKAVGRAKSTVQYWLSPEK